MTTVTKTLKFDAAHLLSGDAGKCGSLHGHTYRVEVSVTAETDGDMVVDFRELKAVVQEVVLDRFDHAFIYNRESAAEREIAAVVEKLGMRTVPLAFRSTAENLAKYFHEAIKAKIPAVSAVGVWETAENHAEYRA